MTFRKKALATTMALTASLAMVTGASAAEPVEINGVKYPNGNTQDVEFGVQGGDLTLTIQDVENFGTVELTGVPQKAYTNFDEVNPFNITDARGTGEGYKLDVSATQFEKVEPAGGFVNGDDDKVTLAPGHLSLNKFQTIERVGGAGMSQELLPEHGEYWDTAQVIDDGSSTFLTAEVGSGKGNIDLTFGESALVLNVDSSQYEYIDKVNFPDEPTPYVSTITWTLHAAP